MGFFSRKKKTEDQEIEFLGVTGQAATLKCLILAGIKGVSLRTTFAPPDVKPDQIHNYQYLDSDERAPSITQGDFSVAGCRAILTYIDIRGVGASLTPRKARILGQQNYWIDVCHQLLAPAVQEIIDGKPGDDAKIRCNEIISSLNKSLGENLFAVGPLSFADPHIAAYVYVLKAHGADLSPYSNVDSWINRLEGQMLEDLRQKYLPILSSTPEQQVVA